MHREASGGCCWRCWEKLPGDFFSKKKDLVSEIFLYIHRQNCYFFLLQALIRLHLLLRCSKDRGSCYSCTTPLGVQCRSDWENCNPNKCAKCLCSGLKLLHDTSWFFLIPVLVVMCTKDINYWNENIVTYSTSRVGNLMVLLLSTREK